MTPTQTIPRFILPEYPETLVFLRPAKDVQTVSAGDVVIVSEPDGADTRCIVLDKHEMRVDDNLPKRFLAAVSAGVSDPVKWYKTMRDTYGDEWRRLTYARLTVKILS